METDPAKDTAAEAVALATVEHHHAGMLTRLHSLTGALVRAVTEHDQSAEHDAHAVLVEWCEDDLLPHALAEESSLYRPAQQKAEARLLVEGMLKEHQAIADLLEELRGSEGVPAAAAASTLERIFALHLEKENRLLLPFIAGAPDLSLAAGVEGLHELTGE